jgi:septal ring factor EnvC (AmiA/AmiB activator)
MVQEDRRSGLLSELARLQVRLEKLKRDNSDLRALIEQITVENRQLTREIRRMLEQTQMMRGIF